MPVTLTFITALSSTLTGHLLDTAKSVKATSELLQQSGHTTRWIVCVDGPVAEEAVPALPGLELANDVVFLNSHFGAAVARNVAASRALDGWVFPLDIGSVMYPKGALALAETIGLMEESVAWVACNRELIDGTSDSCWIDTNRLFAKGELNAEWRPRIFHPNSVAYRTDALFEVGGWPATPGGEDLALTLRMCASFSGAMVTPSVLSLHSHGAQSSPRDRVTLQSLRHDVFARFGLLIDTASMIQR